MPDIEQIEMAAQRARLWADVQALIEKYRAIFEWDVPDIDETASDRLIVAAVHEAVDAAAQRLASGVAR